MRTVSTLVCLALAVTLSSCVISVRDDGDYDDRGDSVAKAEKRNREAIAALPLGQSIEQAQLQLGEPDFTEAFAGKGGEVRVLRYRTHRVHADGDTTKDETTPLIFVGGKLTGIGDAAYAKALTDA